LSFTISNKKDVDFIGKQSLEKLKRKLKADLHVYFKEVTRKPLLLHDELSI